jgi:hypothetical protein
VLSSEPPQVARARRLKSESLEGDAVSATRIGTE